MQGFILVTEAGSLQICQLPSRTLLAAPWLLQKASLRATVMDLCFHRPTSHCVLLTAKQVRTRQCAGALRDHRPDNSAPRLVTEGRQTTCSPGRARSYSASLLCCRTLRLDAATWPSTKAAAAIVPYLLLFSSSQVCEMQVPWKQRMAEEEGGDPHAAYAYAAANAAAKRQGQDLGCEVCSHPRALLLRMHALQWPLELHSSAANAQCMFVRMPYRCVSGGSMSIAC